MDRRNRWLDSELAQLEVPLVIVEANRLVAYANPAAHDLFGMVNGALLGQSIDRLVAPERRGELRNIEDVLAGGGARRVRSVLKRDDGSRLDVSMAVEPCVDAQGRVEAASVRYERIAASGRMSSQPGPLSVHPRGRSMSPEPNRGGGARSEQRLLPTRSGADDAAPHFERLLRDLDWLEARLSQPATIAPLDDSGERARALLKVADMRRELREALLKLKGPSTGEPSLPAPPKLPNL